MNKSIMLALGLLGLIIIWMLTGIEEQQTLANTQKTQAENKLMRVVVSESVAESVAKEVTVQGQVEPNRTISIKAEVKGKVVALPVVVGSRINKGTELANISLETLLADKAQAIANLKYQEQELAATKNLFNKKLESGSRLSLVEANLASAKAALEKVNHEIKNTNIKAPFSGVLDRQFVELGDYVEQGHEVFLMVDDLKLKITAMVPQQQVESLSLGQQVTATLLSGKKLTGALSFISTTADTKTRSYRVEVLVDNNAHRRIVGMTASLSIPVQKIKAHLVKASIISLNKQGQLQVKAVDQNNKVVVYIVEIVRTDASKIWLSGLPDDVELITLGQDFVIAGQTVDVNKQD